MFQILRQQGVDELKASYVPTPKNGQVKDFYEKMGMLCVAEGENGEKEYKACLEHLDLTIQNYYQIEVK